MKTDIEIANSIELKHIQDIAENLELSTDDYESYGKNKAKLNLDILEKKQNDKDAKLVLVTAINPTPAGEGKTTTNIGLSMALNKIGKKSISTLREPSLGPVFGMKGGAAGGGYAQVLPMDEINLHFTGDIHAITTAHNLIAALLDNHLHHGNSLNIDPKRVVWDRVLDMNDRALRNIVIGQGDGSDGVKRESKFDITVTSEIMAIICLAESYEDLKGRLSKMILAYTYDGKVITVEDLQATDALVILLKEALKPNLVQTVDNTPAIIHGGPFANIAHGCNSVLATKTAMKLSDYVITEAGFGSDLGAEKFFDIVCREADLKPDAVVLVATIRALKYNGGQSVKQLSEENLEALEAGYVNLKQHIENMQKYGLPLVLAINHVHSDTETEIEFLERKFQELGLDYVVSKVFAKGSDGGIELAEKVVEACEKTSDFKFIYDADLPLVEKIEKVAREIYRADRVELSQEASDKLNAYQEAGLGTMPICIAKTQYSFSDDPSKLGAPRDFKLTVRDVEAKQGAGFIVIYAGSIMTMPGLPKTPAAYRMKISEDGEISGLS